MVAASPGGADPEGRQRGPVRALGLMVLRGAYDLAWFTLIALGSPWWLWRSAGSRSFRRMVTERLCLRLPRLSPPPPGGRVLIHGVSVGEVKASQSLVAALRPHHDVVVSASTDSGLLVARELYPDLTVVRFPLDFRPVVARFLHCLQPTAIVLLELEIWPLFVRSAGRRGIPTAIVSGRITPASFANYRRFGPTLTQFSAVRLFAAQTETYAERFRALGAPEGRIEITGNVKVDGLDAAAREPDARTRALAQELGLDGARPVLVAGSTHGPEEVLVAGAFRAAAPGARIVLVPRHPPRVPEVVAALRAEGLEPQLLTDLRSGEALDPDRPAVVDTIGELERLYSLATLAFVGGTLIDHGGQNVLEPAARGLAVLHGPDVANFRQEAALLEQAGASQVVRDAAQLEAVTRELLGDPQRMEAMGTAGRGAVEGQRGATERTVGALYRHGLLRRP